MTFLNPAFLWGLLAISVPILIHIFNLRKTRKIEFSTLMFLKEIQQTKYRSIKLKQLLILLCRIGFISLLVIAFAKPYSEGYQGHKTSSSVLIILDDSFSMEGLERNGTRMSVGIKKIKDLLLSLNENDEIYFTTSSSLPYTAELKPQPKYKIEDTLNNIRFSQISRNIDEIIHYSSVILNNSSNDKKEIFLITDLQKHFYQPSGIIKKNVFPDGSHFSIINVADRKFNNISSDTLEVVSGIFEKSRPVKLKLTVNNRNNFNANSIEIILTSGDFRTEKVIDIPSNTSIDVIFELPIERNGFISGYAEILRKDISQDEISLDNRQYFCIYVPDKLRLLALGDPQDFKYIKYATDASAQLIRSESTDNNQEYISIKFSGSTLDEDLSLSDYDLIVVVNKKSFSENETLKFREFLSSGKGVIIYPGSNISAENYNNTFFPQFGLGNGFSIIETASDVKFANIDYKHPLLEGIFHSEINNLSNESPQIIRLFQLPSENNNIPSVSPIILSNGQSFLKEYTYNRAKLILYSVSPDINGSNFASSDIFAPLTLRSILYAGSVNQPQTAITGKDYLINLGEKIADSILLISHEGSNVYLAKNSSFFKIKNEIKSATVYSIYSSDKLISQFASTFDRNESDDAKLTIENIKTLFRDNYGVDPKIYNINEDLSVTVRESRSGRELWLYFLIGSIIFIIAEYLISRSILKTKHPKISHPKNAYN